MYEHDYSERWHDHLLQRLGRLEVKTFGMPWEGQYGDVQAIKVDDTIYVSGQLSHDDRGI